ncbi:MAG: tetratricopeptide repeat protein [Cellvibrionaceae bacterium]|nr:tetratricopeptide repeat protein [Cellvibrionaceae bacterium]MCV6624476.1 tetratricopeptide repeat protein [Cellvibrionaceae bacterium]
MELDQASQAAVEDLCQQGYQLYDQQQYDESLRLFYQAWLKLPKPQVQYPQAAWVLTAIGDSYYKLANYAQALEALNSALHCPSGQLAFIHTRMGQCHYELGQQDLAANHFREAESLDPKQTRKLAPKYRLFIKNQLLKR